MKETGKITTYLSIILLLAVVLMPSSTSYAKNPTKWPYGGVPDSSKTADWLEHTPVIFKQYSDFSYLKFSENADFRFSQFMHAGIFKESEFSETADFWGSKFSETADFRKSKFSGPNSFLGSKFLNGALFSNSRFLESAIFSQSAFLNEAYFQKTLFSEQAKFQATLFKGKADFSFSKFLGEADFWKTQFLDNVNFSFSKFSEQANFIRSKFSKETSFYESTFSENVDFENAIFGTTFNIAGTRFEKGVDLRRTDLSKAKILFDHRTFFPLGTLKAHWSQLKGRLFLLNITSPIAEESYVIHQLLKLAPDSLIAKSGGHHIGYNRVKTKLDSLEAHRGPDDYSQTEIFYHRLRDNYLKQNDRASADKVMYELESKRTEYLREPLWALYGWFLGWGYKPLRFVLTVFLLAVLPFSFLWYKCFYHRVVPLVAQLNEEQKKLLSNPISLQQKTFLKIFKYKTYNHHEASGVANIFARLWHVVHFSASVLFSIRFNKAWIQMEDRAFLTWVTAEWALGIGLYVTFAILVKSYEFGYVKGLLGF